MKPLHETHTAVTIHVVDAAQLAAVYALLGGTSVGAIAAAAPAPKPAPITAEPTKAAVDPAPAVAEPASDGDTAGAAANDSAVDTGGHPWSADLHAATKSQTKEGLWRMKVGVSRPDPLPGSPAAVGAAPTADSEASASGAASAPSTPVVTAPVAGNDEDEFAAFRQAAANADAKDASAAASVAVRKWTDADLGKLCNQAAVKLGDPAPVKDLITAHVPDGTVPHSRNIPEDKRETFAKAVEAKAGITFEG